MKIGIFDSKFGGLLVAKSDKKSYARNMIMYIWGRHKKSALWYWVKGNCLRTYQTRLNRFVYLKKEKLVVIVILVCNTASASVEEIARRIFRPKNFPERKILGVPSFQVRKKL